MSIGNNIKRIRKEKGITQNELAEQMGISRSYLSDLENNRRNPSSKTLESLAEKLDVSLPYLLEGKKMASDLDEDELKAINQGLLEFFEEFKKNLSNSIQHSMENFDFDSLTLSSIFYIDNLLNFRNHYDEDIVRDTANVFRKLNDLMRYINDEGMEHDGPLDNEEKEEMIEFLIPELSKEFNRILEEIRESLRSKIK